MKNLKVMYMSTSQSLQFIGAFTDALLADILPASTEEEKQEMCTLAGEFMSRCQDSHLTQGQIGALFLELSVEILKLNPSVSESCPKTDLN